MNGNKLVTDWTVPDIQWYCKYYTIPYRKPMQLFNISTTLA